MTSRSILSLFFILSLAFAFACSDDGGDATPSPTPLAATETGDPQATAFQTPEELSFSIETFAVPAGSRPHDVAPAADGGVWYTAQRRGALGYLDPTTGETHEIPLGAASAPHGVIVGDNGDAWITDGGLNAIVRLDAETDELTVWELPANRPNANLNTAAFDGRGRLWFTGQNGIYGVLDPTNDDMTVYDAPRGPGPYGITATPGGEIYYASLAGSYMGRIDLDTGAATELDPPTADAGVRRVWSDSSGRIWASEWNAGRLALYDPADGSWREWPLPAADAHAYAIFVDDRDLVWLSDFGSNTLLVFDPQTEEFTSIDLPAPSGEVRQLLGRPGELWAPESAADELVVVRY